VELAESLLGTLETKAKQDFAGLATGDESWFFMRYQLSAMYARSRDEVPPRTIPTIGMSKFMITIFFTGVELISIDVPPKRETFS